MLSQFQFHVHLSAARNMKQTPRRGGAESDFALTALTRSRFRFSNVTTSVRRSIFRNVRHIRYALHLNNSPIFTANKLPSFEAPEVDELEGTDATEHNDTNFPNAESASSDAFLYR